MLRNFQIKMDKEGDTPPAGGGENPPKDTKTPDDLTAKLLARIDALEAKLSQKPDDKDLLDKARDNKTNDEKRNSDAKALEAALTFNLKSQDWLKTNAALLPKDVEEIFKAAEKEKFESPIEKDSAVKAGIIQSFFSVQSNLDLLTTGLKNQLEDYLKLTKNGKQEKAQSIYENIFEPTFEMLKRVKKAEALQKGFGNDTDTDSAYKKKLVNLSRKHYLGEKANA